MRLAVAADVTQCYMESSISIDAPCLASQASCKPANVSRETLTRVYPYALDLATAFHVAASCGPVRDQQDPLPKQKNPARIVVRRRSSGVSGAFTLVPGRGLESPRP
jgi:hypothetical protein